MLAELYDKIIQKYLAQNKLKELDDEERYLHLFAFLSAFVAAVIHIGLFVFYMFIGVPIMVGVNAFSIATYILAKKMILRRNYFVGCLLTTFEVIIYVLITTYYMGAGLYTILYLVLILLLQNKTPYASKTFRIKMGFAIWCCSLVAIFLAGKSPGFIVLSETNIKILQVINVQIMLIGAIALLCASDIIAGYIENDRKNMITQYKNEANTDALTNLSNRRGAEIFAEEIKGSIDIWYVAMMDVDNFKQINDVYGHAAGDEVLKTVAGIVKRTVRSSDNVFRWGGEEFLICLRNVGRTNTYDILEKIRTEIARTVVISGRDKISVTVTIGASLMSTKYFIRSVEECDKLMYIGKQSGKNKVVMAEERRLPNFFI